MAEYSVLGKRLPRVDSWDKVTGRAIYSADINLPNMLCGKVLRSPHAHANIRRLDVSKARALDGVKAVITADDVPGQKEGKELPSILPAFAKVKAVFAGQPVAAVAAEDLRIADQALKLIEVEYEILPPVMDALEAMKSGASIIYPGKAQTDAATPGKGPLPNNVALHREYGRGDVESGFKKADVVLENTYRTQGVHQGYLEPRAAVASIGPDGKIMVWTDRQGIFNAREACATFAKLPLNKIKIMPVEVGGAFGGKICQTLAPICTLLSLKSGYPVKMVTSRAEDFIANRPAPPSTITIKLGADKEGHLIAASATVIYDVGGSGGFYSSAEAGSVNGLSPYLIPNLKVDCYDVYTNKPPSGAYRAPNTPQAAFAMESQMDLLARTLKIDPIELRLKNAAGEGDLRADGNPFPKISFKEILEKMKQHLSTLGKLEGENRGRGIACGFWQGGIGSATAYVNVNADGTVVLAIGSVDLTGSRTSLVQIVAQEFGIPFEKVTVVTGDTESAPYTDMSAGSRTTTLMGIAAHRACQDVKDQLIRYAARRWQKKPEELEFVNGSVRITVTPDKSISIAELASSSISFGSRDAVLGPVTGKGSVGMPQRVPLFAVHMAEVEVDRETGKVRVLSYVAAQDTGLTINPSLVEGQVQGAVTHGMGWALTEEYVFYNGIMQNPTFLDYRMPTSLDAPHVVTLLLETRSGPGPYGLCGVGEPPHVPCLAAIANAIHSAIGVRLKETPMTPEAVFRALRA